MQIDKEFGQKSDAIESLQELLQKLYEADQFYVAAWTMDANGELHQQHITWSFPREAYAGLIHEFSKHLAAERRRAEAIALEVREALRQPLPMAQFAIDAAAEHYPERE